MIAVQDSACMSHNLRPGADVGSCKCDIMCRALALEHICGVTAVLAHLPIHLRAQSALCLTAGTVSMAWKSLCFSWGSLMYDSSSRLYISARHEHGLSSFHHAQLQP